MIGTPDALDTTFKTHRALIAAFGKHAIVAAKMNPDLGRSINQVQQLRQLADYTGDSPPLEEAQLAVTKATTFVAAMEGLLSISGGTSS